MFKLLSNKDDKYIDLNFRDLPADNHLRIKVKNMVEHR